MQTDGSSQSEFWRAVFILAGTTIGAGIFGIPYVTAQVGYPIGLVGLIVLSLFTLVLNVAYAQVIVRANSDGPHQIVGYAEKYLGSMGRKIAFIVILFGQWGAMLAYIIGVGGFLAVIFNLGGSETFFSLLFFVFVAGITAINLRLVAVFESWLTYGMIAIILLIVISGVPSISSANLSGTTISSFLELLAPYGVIMGALGGYAVIPVVRRSLGGDHKKDKLFIRAIAVGTLVPAIVYMLFQLVVVGVSGIQTSEDAISGLVLFMDTGIIRIGALFGILAMFSSFLTLTYVLRDTFYFDFSMPPLRSWFLAIVPPLLIFLVGFNSFIAALELVGAWSGVMGTILIVAMYVTSYKSNDGAT